LRHDRVCDLECFSYIPEIIGTKMEVSLAVLEL